MGQFFATYVLYTAQKTPIQLLTDEYMILGEVPEHGLEEEVWHS